MDKIYDIIEHKLTFNVGGKDMEIDLRQLIWPASAFSVFYLLFWKKSGFQDMTFVKQLKAQHEERANPDDVPYKARQLVLKMFILFISFIYCLL